jgi:hypothetical protein
MKPRPLLGVTAAIASFGFFWRSTDEGRLDSGYYILAAGLMIAGVTAFLMWPLQRQPGSAWEQMAARLAEALIFVGYGYCTKEGPGVIKLGGVIPMGWTCAVMALLAEHLAVLRNVTALRPFGAPLRMFMLCLGLIMQAVTDPPWSIHTHDANQLLTALVAAFLISLADMVWQWCVRRCPETSQSPTQQ